jgi:predicted Fe-Mo cluster-binding NifX family protein
LNTRYFRESWNKGGETFLQKLRIAIATNEKKGLGDVVSNVFGRAKTFTIIDAEGENIKKVTILENSAVSYHHGAGPIVVKMLMDKGVKMVLSNELGFGANELLEQHNIKHILIKPNTEVRKAFRELIHKLKEENI